MAGTLPLTSSVAGALGALPGVVVREGVPLSQYTRFGIGGTAAVLVDAENEVSFLEALRVARGSGMAFVVLGAGSNVVVSDAGFDGLVLRYTARKMRCEGSRIVVETGAVLQDLVDFSITCGLAGLHTMTGIPGWVGAAVYGNAGAYGHSIHEFVRRVRLSDGVEVREFTNAACEFAYRESVFKRHKEWVLLAAELELPAGDAAVLKAKADEILAVRNAKYPPAMKCAGSIFKNCFFAALPDAVQAEVPESIVREGKVPSAWFLEKAGGKGLRRGDIQVASYHANLVYNDGAGTAVDLRAVIGELKGRVRDRFGFELEEEVQYVGF